MSKDSSQAASVHEKLTDTMEKYVTANKKLKSIEEVEKKQNKKIAKLEVNQVHTCIVYWYVLQF